MQDITENNDLNQWGQAILRAKTTLIKPQSKVRDEEKLISELIRLSIFLVYGRRSSSTFTK